MVVDGGCCCSRRAVSWITLELWAEVDVLLDRSTSFALFSSFEFCFSSLSFRLRSSSSFFASVLALEKPCRGAKLPIAAATPELDLPAPVCEENPAVSEDDDDDDDGAGALFEGSERDGGGELRPFGVSRLVRDGGKWLADIFGKEDDMVESRRRSCKRVRSTPPSGFWEKLERVEKGESPSRRGTCWGCERVADLGGDGGEASEISTGLLTDKGLVRLVGMAGLEPDRVRRWLT